MATMTVPQQMPDTFTLTVPKADVNFFKTIAKKMGWTIKRNKVTTRKSFAHFIGANSPVVRFIMLYLDCSRYS